MMFAKFWGWLSGEAKTEEAPEAVLAADVARLVRELEALGDATSFAIALAAERHDELTKQIERHEAQMTDRAAPASVIAAHIEELRRECATLQSDAETQATLFFHLKQQVDDRLEQLPQLQAAVRLSRNREELESQGGDVVATVGELTDAFDDKAESIEFERTRLRHLAALNAESDKALG
jgi:hypothetical protein